MLAGSQVRAGTPIPKPWRPPPAAGGAGLRSLSGAALALSPGMSEAERDPLVGEIIGAAIEVHRVLGPGMLESAYGHCLEHELIRRGFDVQREVRVPLKYKDTALECGYRLDMLVAQQVIVEIKAVEKLLPLHTAQMLTYLQLTGKCRGLLLNFHGLTLKAGLRSFMRRGTETSVEENEV